ncbi:MAG: DNA-3-methyladenine glycosylase [Methanomassiliicoccales archaeon]|nr:DNA-3-methyladenine glycosylase [Methanomassiliicoccales archaeon]
MLALEYGRKELDHLRKRDRRLGQVIDRVGMIETELSPDLFSALVNSIVCQQISGKAADTVWGRVKERFGDITPERFFAASIQNIQTCGMSFRKAEYVRGIAEACVQGNLDLEALNDLSDEEVIKRLSALRGVGIWTAEMMLIFSLQRPDVVSWSDLAIRRGMTVLYGLDKLDKDDFERYRKRYSPYGSIASLYLWKISHE